MEEYVKAIFKKGDERGNEMVVKFQLPSGLEIIGLPTQNFYGGQWDLGPTWNYIVMTDKPFLVDSGRFGQGKSLAAMMQSIGIHAEDLEFVLITHSHEDHDGGLAELIKSTRLNVKAHALYDRLTRKYPEQAPPGYKEEFPAKCWHCVMPKSFYTENCLGYHRVLQDLEIDKLGDGETLLASDTRCYHLPGHSPDCVAVLLGQEAIIVGDIVLPDISPWPTRESLFDEVADVIQSRYVKAEAIFGLRRYITSLKKLAEIAQEHGDLFVLPGHRFYYNNQWNRIHLADRVGELLQHHVNRCAAILDILRIGPKTTEKIAQEHFEERLLEGFGNLMAANEIRSHCELLMAAGDVVAMNEDKYAVTGSTNFETVIDNLRPDY